MLSCCTQRGFYTPDVSDRKTGKKKMKQSDLKLDLIIQSKQGTHIKYGTQGHRCKAFAATGSTGTLSTVFYFSEKQR